jgi:hypothetical protein
MGGGYASSGFEIGNELDRRAYPVARLKRPGAPPASQPADFDPLAPRLAPIRARPTAFGLREINGRALLAFGPYVGPGLIKRLDVGIFTTQNGNPQPHLNLFRNTAPYTSANNLALTTLPAGTPVFEAKIADDQPVAFADEGGLSMSGGQTLGWSVLIDVFVGDATFYLALVTRNNQAAAVAMYGSLLVYEGVQASDFPGILG